MADGSEAGITSAACCPDPAAGVGIPWIGTWNPPLTWGDTFVEVVKRIPDCPLIPGEKSHLHVHVSVILQMYII